MALTDGAEKREEQQDRDVITGGIETKAIEAFEFEVNRTGDQIGLSGRSENSLAHMKFYMSADDAEAIGQELIDAAKAVEE